MTIDIRLIIKCYIIFLVTKFLNYSCLLSLVLFTTSNIVCLSAASIIVVCVRQSHGVDLFNLQLWCCISTSTAAPSSLFFVCLIPIIVPLAIVAPLVRTPVRSQGQERDVLLQIVSRHALQLRRVAWIPTILFL